MTLYSWSGIKALKKNKSRIVRAGGSTNQAAMLGITIFSGSYTNVLIKFSKV